MEYHESRDETIFLPIKTPTSKLFYGTEHFMYFCRMFFTLYERILRAWEIANTFETNSRTEKLTAQVNTCFGDILMNGIAQEKTTLSKERYDAFKWVLVHLIRGDVDNIKYEDFIRGLFGKNAYALVVIDKIVGSVN